MFHSLYLSSEALELLATKYRWLYSPWTKCNNIFCSDFNQSSSVSALWAGGNLHRPRDFLFCWGRNINIGNSLVVQSFRTCFHCRPFDCWSGTNTLQTTGSMVKKKRTPRNVNDLTFLKGTNEARTLEKPRCPLLGIINSMEFAEIQSLVSLSTLPVLTFILPEYWLLSKNNK